MKVHSNCQKGCRVTLSMQRREFLRRAGLTGAAAVAVAAGLPRPAAAQDADLAPFLHGVASGDPLHDRVILWTRVTPPTGHDERPIPVRWVVATDVEFGNVVAAGTVDATAQRDWTVRVDPTGLEPFTYYFYAFQALGQASLVGRTKTAAAPGQAVDHVRLGVVSCANYQEGFFNAYARLADRDDLDAIICTGDYLYEYEDGGYGPGSAIGRGHEPPVEMTELVHYRGRHGHYKLDPDLRRLHQLFPWVTTWDDHESANNSWRDGAANHDDSEGDWAERKAWCQQAYDEWMPIRPTGDRAKIYRHLPWGDLVDVVVMDTRLEGRNRQVTYPGTDTENLGGLIVSPDASDPNRHIVSPTQMEFVTSTLSASPARWKLVAQQVIVSQWNAGAIPLLPEEVRSLDFPMLVRDGGNAANADAWDGYQADQLQFMRHIGDNAIDNVVILTGDVHSSWAFDVTTEPSNPTVYNPVTGDGSVAVEIVCPAVASESLGDTFNGITMTPVGADAFEAAMRANNPQLKYLDSRRQGFVILDITPEHCQADWFYVTVEAPNDAEEYGASWEARHAANRLTAAAAASEPKAPAPQRPAPGAVLPSGDPEPAPGPLPATGGGAVVLGAAAVVGAVVLRRRGGQGTTAAVEAPLRPGPRPGEQNR